MKVGVRTWLILGAFRAHKQILPGLTVCVRLCVCVRDSAFASARWCEEAKSKGAKSEKRSMGVGGGGGKRITSRSRNTFF